MNTYATVLLIISLVTAFWQGLRTRHLRLEVERHRAIVTTLQNQLDGFNNSRYIASQLRRTRELCELLTVYHTKSMLDVGYVGSALHMDLQDVLEMARLENFSYKGVHGSIQYNRDLDQWEGALYEYDNLTYKGLSIASAEENFREVVDKNEHVLKTA